MAQISNGKANRNAHLPCHDDEAHIPAQRGYDEQYGPTRLEISVSNLI